MSDCLLRPRAENRRNHPDLTVRGATSNTYGQVLEQRQRQVARATDAVLRG